MPLMGSTPSNLIGTGATLWGGVISWGGAEAAQTAAYTTKALQTARVLGNGLGVVSAIPSAYNTVSKTLNSTSNTADFVDLGVSGSIVVTGFLLSNPVGLGILAVGGLGYGIYRIGWGDSADTWINDNFGFR